jgi:RNA polymerase sigma factor (sigma-70 family)
MVNAQLRGVLRYLGSLHDAQALTEASDAQLLARFAGGHEEAPFAALVRRHGPMVWSVARRVLAQVQDAEDVFQATFLLLARKAATIRKAESVGCWLHGVAHRLALKAREQQARRRSREKRAADMRQTSSGCETSLSDVAAALDGVLVELPEKYRAALVLCYLEGQTQEEAARRLGCPLATVRTRLARGRKLLRDRLAKRGLTLSTAGLATLLIASAAPAAAPAALVKAAIQAALPFAAGQSAAALCSVQAAGLVQEGLKAMFLTKLKTAMALLLLAAGLIGGGAALTQPVTAGDDGAKPRVAVVQPSAAKQAEPAAPKAAELPAPPEQGSIAYGGRVLAPDGQPVAGAKVYMTHAWGYPHHPSPSPDYATSGPDGRFRFTVPKARFVDRATVVAAAAANYGVGWVDVPADAKRDDLTPRLAKDDVQITGQIVDLEGKPVSGATLRLLQICAAPQEDLGPFLEAVKAKKGTRLQLEQQYLTRRTIAVPLQVRTDGEGRFRLKGIGPNRLVEVQLDGPTIVSQHLHMLTQAGEAITVTEYAGKPEYNDPRKDTTYYGSNFRHVAAPTKPIVGVVRDKDTKKPLAGVPVQSLAVTIGPGHRGAFDLVRTTTDAQGRYRLTGMPKHEGNWIAAFPDLDVPYIPISRKVPDSPGLDPVTVDMELPRGVWIEGKITDKVSSQPLRASLEYFSLYSNPNLKDYAGFDGTYSFDHLGAAAKEDGSYRIAGLPGPGLIAVYSPQNHYLRAPYRDDEYGTTKRSMSTSPYHISFTENYAALALVDPAKGTEVVKRDVTLDPGWTFTGTVLGPDGQPLAGAWSFGVFRERGKEKAAEFRVHAFNPRRPHAVLFQHLQKKLVGVAQPPKENGGSVTVQMGPGAAVTGRLVDAEGRPQAGVKLDLQFRPEENSFWDRYPPEQIQTDQEGRFRVEALLPGYEFRLADDKGGLAFRVPRGPDEGTGRCAAEAESRGMTTGATDEIIRRRLRPGTAGGLGAVRSRRRGSLEPATRCPPPPPRRLRRDLERDPARPERRAEGEH